MHTNVMNNCHTVPLVVFTRRLAINNSFNLRVSPITEIFKLASRLALANVSVTSKVNATGEKRPTGQVSFSLGGKRNISAGINNNITNRATRHDLNMQ